MRKCHRATIILLDTETVFKISNIFSHCEVIWGVSIENWLTKHFWRTRDGRRCGVLGLPCTLRVASSQGNTSLARGQGNFFGFPWPLVARGQK